MFNLENIALYVVSAIFMVLLACLFLSVIFVWVMAILWAYVYFGAFGIVVSGFMAAMVILTIDEFIDRLER